VAGHEVSWAHGGNIIGLVLLQEATNVRVGPAGRNVKRWFLLLGAPIMPLGELFKRPTLANTSQDFG
jgi:hypothetical protein